jgi:hypothetical protein
MVPYERMRVCLKRLNMTLKLKLFVAVAALLHLGACTSNVAEGPWDPDGRNYAVIAVNGWINEWVWVREMNGAEVTHPSWGIIGANFHRLKPGEHELAFHYHRGQQGNGLPYETATVTLEGGRTYRVKPTFQKGDEWVDFDPKVTPQLVTADAIKYEVVEVDPGAMRKICLNTEAGMACSQSLRVRP